MTRGRKTAVFSVVGLFLLLAAAGYYFRGHQGGDSSIQKKSAVPPGILTGVTYSHTSGMVARADFAITLSPEAILETSYYPALDPDTAEDEDWYHPSTKENVPITVAQWSDVEQIILELYPLMEPIPENRREMKLPPGIEVMDGGDSTSLILTWSTEDGTRSIRYDPPNDRRIHTLIALLEELADPIGREIPRYAPPELSGFYMGQSGALFSKDYSFQFDRGPSVVYGEDAPYILRARFTPSGRKQEIWSDWAVSDEEWDAFTAFAEEIRLEQQLDGSSEKPACTLYYSDGKQQQKKLDQETAKQLRAYFTELALCLLDEQPLKRFDYDGASLKFVEDIVLDAEYEDISADTTGTLWLANFMEPLISWKDGAQTASYEGPDHVTMHPSGTWGVSWFSGPECEKITLSGGALKTEPMVFQEVDILSHLLIDDSHIYVCGSAVDGSGHKVFVYDSNGALQMTLADSDGGGLGSITFITQTANGYLALDGNMREVVLWSKDGTYLGEADDGDLFGTDYPWFCGGAKLADGSILAIMTEDRADESAMELVAFKLSGF